MAGLMRITVAANRFNAYNSHFKNEMTENAVAVRAGTIDQKLILANAQNKYGVRAKDLPLSCPMPDMYLWNSHPKVYLPIEATGEAKCPYCGAQYEMLSGDE
jgi:uncharacterized Zn-finger protein